MDRWADGRNAADLYTDADATEILQTCVMLQKQLFLKEPLFPNVLFHQTRLTFYIDIYNARNVLR